jgi:hypothetical protein
MKSDVPHPTTATRAPRGGSARDTLTASSAARRQQAGWVAISSSANDTVR